MNARSEAIISFWLDLDLTRANFGQTKMGHMRINYRSYIALILATWLICVGCQKNAIPNIPADADLSTTTTALVEFVDQTLDQLESEGFYGVALLTQGDEVLLHKALGYRDREANAPMQLQTGFDIGSITKAITAATILKLEENGELTLSDTVSQFFPNAPAPLSNVTVAQLLDHTSGLPEYLGDDYELVNKQQALDRLFAVDLQFPPGSEEAYSNAGYSLLALIVEAASGQPYEATVQDLVLQPAGTPEIGYQLAGWQNEDLAVGYLRSNRWGTPLTHAWLADGPSWTLRGNGGMLATVADTQQWFEAVFSGQVLEPAALDAFKQRFAGTSTLGTRVGEAGGNDVFNAQHEAWPDFGVAFTFFTSRSELSAEDAWDQVGDVVTQLAKATAQERQ